LVGSTRESGNRIAGKIGKPAGIVGFWQGAEWVEHESKSKGLCDKRMKKLGQRKKKRLEFRPSQGPLCRNNFREYIDDSGNGLRQKGQQ